MMLGLNLENTTSEDFRVTFTGRYLAFDVLGSGSELRIDGTLGSDPGIGLHVLPSVWRALFVEPYAGMVHRTFNVIQEDAVVASYGQTLTRGGIDLGVNLGRVSDLRLGTYVGRLKANVDVGDPGLPEVNGKEVVSELRWRYDSQDSQWSRAAAAWRRRASSTCSMGRTSSRAVTQRSHRAPNCCSCPARSADFWPSGEQGRFFALGGGGTSFGKQPLPTDQFTLGRPFHLGAHDQGEFVGDHYYIATGGYLHQLGRLPDFMGGPLFAGAWIENGDAFNSGEATFRTNQRRRNPRHTGGPRHPGGLGGF